ncbi:MULTISPECIES: sensor histidine kinase [Nocardioides]|uniref:histidine kinase n=1 Tax=Nocardioides vastitatis TaxID=2568655 RepID=A0ABW0ZIK6_9ACTN|nr:sensor histidine kinase [Nocardioides sp.]THJ09215.1 sensor histidine kinase [Nocardioides sp.]
MSDTGVVRRRRPSLAGQLLVLQVFIVLVVVAGVVVVTLAQTDVAFRRQESRRVLEVAETIAANRVVQTGLTEGTSEGTPGVAEAAVSTYGASYVIVTDAGGGVVYSSLTSDRGVTTVERPGAGRQWVGISEDNGTRAVEARVPVFDNSAAGEPVGTLVGYVVAGREYPTAWERLGETAPTLTVYVLLASLVGFGGSLLLSRRIKRQTLGLEPQEIAGLVEHREAMLHGLREGVVGVDQSGRITLVNDEATRVLALPEPPVGARVDDLPVPARVTEVLSGRVRADDLVILAADRVLVLNQMPVRVRDQLIGWVTTLRDRTELVDLNRQLDVWRSTTDGLRAQAHEFANRMHTVAGLIELGEYEEAAQFATAQSDARAGWVEKVTSRIKDPALAALLVAKDSRAGELGVHLDLHDESRLPRVSESLSADLLTVTGNLLDNSMEAVAAGEGRVVVRAAVEDGAVVVSLSDDGPGIPAELADRVFEQGFSTKATAEPGARGWGLTLTKVVCERRGGRVSVDRRDGHTVFTAILPGDLAAEEEDR